VIADILSYNRQVTGTEIQVYRDRSDWKIGVGLDKEAVVSRSMYTSATSTRNLPNDIIDKSNMSDESYRCIHTLETLLTICNSHKVG